MRSVHPDRLMQDSDTLKYIDLQAVHDQTVRINQTLSTYETGWTRSSSRRTESGPLSRK